MDDPVIAAAKAKTAAGEPLEQAELHELARAILGNALEVAVRASVSEPTTIGLVIEAYRNCLAVGAFTTGD